MIHHFHFRQTLYEWSYFNLGKSLTEFWTFVLWEKFSCTFNLAADRHSQCPILINLKLRDFPKLYKNVLRCMIEWLFMSYFPILFKVWEGICCLTKNPCKQLSQDSQDFPFTLWYFETNNMMQGMKLEKTAFCLKNWLSAAEKGFLVKTDRIKHDRYSKDRPSTQKG